MFIDWVLITLWILLIFGGLVGSVAPILPWPVLSMIGLLIIQRSQKVQFSRSLMVIMMIAVVVSMVLDYYLPIRWTKRYGGTKAWVLGSTIGMVLGIFVLPPFGVIIFPCVWAFFAEYYVSKLHGEAALKAARWSFVWFMIGTGYKLVLCGWMLVVVVSELAR